MIIIEHIPQHVRYDERTEYSGFFEKNGKSSGTIYDEVCIAKKIMILERVVIERAIVVLQLQLAKRGVSVNWDQ
jgi:hypothetical protein